MATLRRSLFVAVVEPLVAARSNRIQRLVPLVRASLFLRATWFRLFTSRRVELRSRAVVYGRVDVLLKRSSFVTGRTSLSSAFDACQSTLATHSFMRATLMEVTADFLSSRALGSSLRCPRWITSRSLRSGRRATLSTARTTSARRGFLVCSAGTLVSKTRPRRADFSPLLVERRFRLREAAHFLTRQTGYG